MLEAVIEKFFSALIDLLASIILAILAGVFYAFMSADEALDGNPNENHWDF